MVQTNLFLTEHEGHTGEYWPEVVSQYGLSEARSVQKTTEDQYSPVQLELAMVSK